MKTIDETDPRHDGCTCMLLLSFRIEKGTCSNGQHAGIANIASLIKGTASQIVSFEENEINATFSDIDCCLEAAAQVMQSFENNQSGDDVPSPKGALGLHAVKASGSKIPLDAFYEAIAARNTAGPGETIITDACYRLLSDTNKQACTRKTHAGEPSQALYVLFFQSAGRKPPRFSCFLPEEAGTAGEGRCFYCASAAHSTRLCPSKHIQHTTNALEKLGYLPYSQIKNTYKKSFHNIVRPLSASMDAERFEMILHEDTENPAALAFFSFYEISRIFQIRCFRELFLHETDKKGAASKGAGAVKMGIDCLRVGRFDEAKGWLDKAIQDNPNDVGTHIVLGLLDIEKGEAKSALTLFRKAHSLSVTNFQKGYIQVLRARLYAISDALQNAAREMKDAMRLVPDWPEVRYYHAVLYAKAGQTNTAVDLLKVLVRKNPVHCMVVFIDPELYPARRKLMEFLNTEMDEMHKKGARSMTSISANLKKYALWMDKNDEQYKHAQELYQKASGIVRDESILGFFDIPAIEFSINSVLENAYDKRVRNLRKKIIGYENILDNTTVYLEGFPYRSAVRAQEHAVRDTMRSLIHRVKTIVSAMKNSADFQKAEEIFARLEEVSQRIAKRRQRLEMVKNIFFAAECLLKMLQIFFITAISTAVIFTTMFIVVKGFDRPLSTMNTSEVLGFVKYGCIAGFCAGITGSAVWFKTRFKEKYRNIQR